MTDKVIQIREYTLYLHLQHGEIYGCVYDNTEQEYVTCCGGWYRTDDYDEAEKIARIRLNEHDLGLR